MIKKMDDSVRDDIRGKRLSAGGVYYRAARRRISAYIGFIRVAQRTEHTDVPFLG